MKYQYDNDLHIHSEISLCSNDPEQTKDEILNYALRNGLKTICVTDHFWDETVEGASDWYAKQNFAHISAVKPLHQANGVKFLFGCETELNKNLTIGIAKEHFDRFDFVIIPTTHFHMLGYTISEKEAKNAKTRAQAWIRRLDAVLNMDLPFKKVGIAHLTCPLIAPDKEEFFEVIRLLPENELYRLFAKAANLGVGIELNAGDMEAAQQENEIIFNLYFIAKECGCKFYLGSDAHHPNKFNEVKSIFEKAIDKLGLEESDKFLL